MQSLEPRLPTAAVSNVSGELSDKDPLVGSLLSERYRLFSLLGEGGMGRVYMGEHVHMRKRVAVKILHRELTQVAEVVTRFEREAMAAANIDHPNVAAATDFGKLPDGSVFLVLEYVQGMSLRDVISEGHLPVERAMRIARQITSALVSAHALGIVHRDLKPENVMLVEKGGDPDFVKVLDFGIAKVPVQEVSERGSIRPAKVITRVGMIFGTPEYMAPEQALGQNVDGRADLYAVGIILFEMLCGRRPFSAESPVGILGQQLQGPLPTFSKRAPHVRVPVAFEQLVLRLLAPAAASRFQTAEELALAIDGLLAQLALVARESAHRAAMMAGRVNPFPPLAEDGGKAELDDDVLNGSTLPAPEYDAKSTKLSHDTPSKDLGFVQSLEGISRARILVWVIAGTVASVLAVGSWLVLRASKLHTPAPVASITAALRAPAAPSPAPATILPDVQLEAARKSGVAALLRLTEEYPKDVRVWGELARAQLATGRTSESVDAVKAAYQVDHASSNDARLATVLWKTAQKRETSEKTLDLLGGGFGERGVDILYDLTLTPGVRKDIRKAAGTTLYTMAAQNAASAALKALLSLQGASRCEDKLAVLPKVESDADARALPLLTSLRITVGCGNGKRTDCYACMRKGLQLENAIAAIRKRDGLQP